MGTVVAGEDNIVAGEGTLVLGIEYILVVEKDIAVLDMVDLVCKFVGDRQEQMDILLNSVFVCARRKIIIMYLNYYCAETRVSISLT